jgi:hypothetical protein
MRRRPSWLIHAVCRHASNGGLPASTRHDDGSRFTGTAWIWYDRSSARSTASTTGAATQSEAERRCMQPMAHAWAMRQGARRGWPWAGNAASGCASPDGGTMHADERVDIAIGHRGGRGLRCTCMELGRVLDTCIAAKAIAPMSRIADCATSSCTATTRLSFPRLPASRPSAHYTTQRARLQLPALPICVQLPWWPPPKLSGQALVWSLGQLLSP